MYSQVQSPLRVHVAMVTSSDFFMAVTAVKCYVAYCPALAASSNRKIVIASQFLLKTTFEYLSSSSCIRRMSVQIATKVYKKDLSVKQATEVWLVLGLFYSLDDDRTAGDPATIGHNCVASKELSPRKERQEVYFRAVFWGKWIHYY